MKRKNINKQSGMSLIASIAIGAIIGGLILSLLYWYDIENEEPFDLDSLEPDFVDLDLENPMDSCIHTTGHNSCIVDNVDTVLIGPWVLQSETIEVGGQIRTSKLSGKTIHFKSDGTYTEDYSTEVSEEKTVTSPDISFTTKCKAKGLLTGRFENVHHYNPSDPHSDSILGIILDSEDNREVFCQNAQGEYVKTGKNITTRPLSSGPGGSAAGFMDSSMVISHKYNLSSNLPRVLTITYENPNGVTIKQTYIGETN